MKVKSLSISILAFIFILETGVLAEIQSTSHGLQRNFKKVVNCDLTGPSCERDCSNLPSAGQYQFCGNCSFFLVCSGGETFIAPCAPGLYWDDEVKRCDALSTTCWECYVPPKCLYTGGSCIRDCQGRPDDVYQLCYNCTSYARCTGGVLSVEHCPEGLVWNDDPPKGCSQDSETCHECLETSLCESTGPACISDCLGRPDGRYQSCSACFSFARCRDNQMTYDLCPPSWHWDDDRLGCFESSSTCVQCAASDKCASTGDGCISRCLGQADGNYQACANCSSFIQCSGGHTTYLHCNPPDWLWDQNVQACLPTSATCEECIEYKGNCPDGFFKIPKSESCYKVMTNPTSYQYAHDNCTSFGPDVSLVGVETDSEYDSLIDYFKANPPSSQCNAFLTNAMKILRYSTGAEPVYGLWTTHGETFTQFRWQQGEPDHNTQADLEICIELGLPDLLMADVSCIIHEECYLCEKQADKS